MQQTWEHMLNGLRSVLEHDPNIRPDAFDRQFTVEKFADVLFFAHAVGITSAGLRSLYRSGNHP